MQTGFDVSSICAAEDFTAWVPYNDQVAVLVRHIPREKLSGILRQATKTTWDQKHQPENNVDNIKYGELIGEAAIVDWTGLIIDDKPFPCTKENRGILMRKWGSFAKFISDLSSDIERLMESQQEAVRKN